MIEIGDIPLPSELMAVPSVIQTVIPDIAEAVRNEIVRMAHTKLHSTSQDYVLGVMPVKYHFPSGSIPMEGTPVVATIVLVGQLPNMLEAGWSGGDMKAALLGGKSAKTAADGTRYATVPFRHGTPKASGRNFPAMGSAHAGDLGKEIGKRVYGRARRLKPRTSEHRGTHLPAGLAPKLRQHHKTDIYAGMTKTKGPGRSTQYRTFRRVSEKSAPQSWIHPGIEPAGIFVAANDYASRVASTILKGAMRE